MFFFLKKRTILQFEMCPGRSNVIGHGVGAVLGIAGLVWGSSTIQHQIQLQVAAVNQSIAFELVHFSDFN